MGIKRLFIGSLLCAAMFSSSHIACANAGIYQYTNDFAQTVQDNPLDRAYSREFKTATTTLEYAELENKYIALWDRELNGVYNTLLGKLSGEEKERLVDAQVAWLDWHIKERAFVNRTWLEQRKLGSQGPVQELKAEKLRLRERTLELLEYDCLLGGEVKFAYQPM